LEKKWVIPKTIDKSSSEELEKYPVPIRQLLFSRGFRTREDADTFLESVYKVEDPFLLKNMKEAVERLRQAILNKEIIAIYGDYDVDGVTATALLIEVIRGLGGTAIEYIPNRFDEGYGLNQEALDFLRGQHVNVVVTVDCGIRSPEEARHARDLGIDLIISDHHHPKGEVPEAMAVICQKQPGDDYPNKDLAGVGLAYKIGQALCQAFPYQHIVIEDWLDLVALGTVADVVPLTGENRVLVHGGIQRLRSGMRLGMVRLANVSDTNLSAVSSFEIGFRLAPRLNASGRLESALDSLHLLLSTDDKAAAELAMKLDTQNRERQRITREIQQKAEELTASDESSFLMFAVDKDFNQGVVGLAASRLVEKYYRPAIVAARGDTQTRGSCRSIPEFHITNALDECAHLLIRHGGHAMAAGFTVSNENVPELEARLKEITRAQLHELALMPSLKVDAVSNLSELRPELMDFLNKFQPTGLGNPEPLFLVRGMKIKGAWQVGTERSHLKLKVTDGRVTFDAIAFRMGEYYDHLPHEVDAVFSFELNTYLDRQTLQLNIKDMRATGGSDHVP
jgi:single-stranded-DNA-specific exonuclease